MTDILKLTRNGHVLEVVFDRPPVNAIDAATSRRIAKAFIEFREDPELRVAILTGVGDRVFSAGWDLKAAESEDTDWGPGGFAGLTRLDLNKPVIAAVNGRAIGGGFELALCCDIIVAAENADFSLPEAERGVVADAGGLQTFPRRVPHHVAMEMLLTGRRMPAAEAMQWGLVNAVVPRAQLMDKAREYARVIADGAPLSVQATKEVIRAIEGMPIQDTYAFLKKRTLPIYTKMLTSEDHVEGPRAFAEKRKPVWKGR